MSLSSFVQNQFEASAPSGFSNPFGGTVPTQKNQDILNEDFNYKRPVEQTPTPVIPVNPTQPTAEPIRPVLTSNNPYNNALNSFNSSNPDEDKIRLQEEERARLQRQVEALNTIYDKQLADQKQVYTGLQGQSRALASRGGRLESPIYQAQQIGLSDKQQQLEGVINAERTQQVANLYDRVEKRVQDKLAAERTFATSERDKYLDILKDQQKQAKGDLVTFSQGGGSLTDLTTEQYQKLLNDTGFDDFTLKATMSVNNPKSKAQFSAVGDKIVGYYVNPKTGQFETFESKEIPGLSGKGQFDSVKEFGGVPYVMTKDENGVISGKPLDGYTKPEEKLSGAPAEYEYYKKQEEAAGRTPVSFNEYQTQDANRKEQVVKSELTAAQINSTVNSIASAFDNEPIVKNYNTVQEGFNTINSIGVNTASPADDIAFIYAFAKIMDPGSVVREGEYNTIQKYAQTWADNFGFKAKRVFSNTNFLTPDAKQKMLNTLKPKVDTVSNQYENLSKEYQRQIADTYVGNPRQITDYSGKTSSNTTEPASGGWF